ncbi:uncharacterized protein LOC126995392 isoform X2 [Eriocheir sinensis]|uniref:uncharacterized protein LOC126995392 isoform X2 n=1 Tax=Eriocheir sinensis TaxID=95602 RepID=UPI0021C87650|nr:uncharacterized protein LOC126995392 isoform X2 [Eriocheir sinensis]
MTSCQVEGKVDGVLWPVVVDTGSERTLVRPDVVSHRRLPKTSHRLCGVTGHYAELRGPVDVKFELGGKEEFLSVYVADMDDSCILGMDYLVSYRCELDFRAKQLTVGGRRVPLMTVNKEDLPVTIKRTTIIPPRSEMLLPCQITGASPASLCVVESGSRCPVENGVIVGSTLVDPAAAEVPVVVANVSFSPKKIEQGTMVGLCQEIDQEPRTCVCRRTLTKPQEELPDYLRDLFDRSSRCLEEPQVEQLRELLVRNANVFSTGDLDLGCTDLEEHHIDTGSHRPVKQAPRRMAPARRKEMGEIICELRERICEQLCSPRLLQQ